ncbi:MAG TPA: BatA domain-containing protein [Candidatus Methylacidiphilales bacterium]|jgi:hypothetical protein|nr:BatA domain-containing protein [Candidatus Methylacidiphilales bacterium]
MAWLYPLFLTGMAALAAPVLIHLLMKAQGRKIPFSTLRFFTTSQGTRGKKKIRHWLLLLMRLLMVALLVAAFARPFWSATGSGDIPPQQRRAVVILLDRSASMQAQGSDQAGATRWNAAVLATRKILEGLSATDHAAIVGDAEQAEVVAPWGSPGMALELLAPLTPTNEAGRLADGLLLAGSLFAHAPPGAQRELMIVSDLQKTGCLDLDSVSLPIGIHYEIKRVATSQASNLAITDLTLEGVAPPVLKATLGNFSQDKIEGARLVISVDQQPFSQITVDIGKESSVQATLPNLALSPGWHDLKMEVKQNDALALDNQFYASVRVPQPITVLVVEQHPEEKIYRRSSYFITSALDPTPETGDTQSPDASYKTFAVTTLSPEALFRALDADSGPPQVVVLPPLAEIAPGLGAALKSYVQRGGGLLVWGGPGIGILDYNTELGDLLPAHFDGVETPDETALDANWQLGWWSGESSLFQMFQKPGHGDLTLPKFRQRLKLEVGPGAEVLATYDDKTPFLLSSKVGRGRILMINSSPDTHWSDWPIHKTFLPLVDEMTLFLAQNEGSASLLLARSLAPTRHGEFDLGTDRAHEQVRIARPDGKTIQAQTDELGMLHRLDLEQPGPYQIRNMQNEELQRFCVNFPAVESNLEITDAHEITGMLRFQDVANDPSHAADNFSSLQARREFGPWLMLLLLPLLLLELFWANRSRA